MQFSLPESVILVNFIDGFWCARIKGFSSFLVCSVLIIFCWNDIISIQVSCSQELLISLTLIRVHGVRMKTKLIVRMRKGNLSRFSTYQFLCNLNLLLFVFLPTHFHFDLHTSTVQLMHDTVSPQKSHHFYTEVQSCQWEEAFQLLASSSDTKLTLVTEKWKMYVLGKFLINNQLL